MGNAQPRRGNDAASLPSKMCVEREIKLGDTTYELFVGTCKCGRHPVYRLMRTCGALLSIYEISEDDYQNLDNYVSQLHASYTVDVTTRLHALREAILATNSNGLFEAQGMHPSRVRMIDKARLICNRFSKNGLLKEILEHADDIDNDVTAAFILGCIATDSQWLALHEEAVFEGYAHIEGRESGRPLALAARRRQGKRTRNAVVTAASQLYDQNSSLRRNDSKTAECIANMKLAALRKRDGTYLGTEAIVKHLRATRASAAKLGKS